MFWAIRSSTYRYCWELERRGLSLTADEIVKVLVEMPPADAPVVLLNDEVKLVGQVRATRDITKGEEITTDDYDEIVDLWPESVHEDSGWACFAAIGRHRVVAFEFRYNQGRPPTAILAN